jgi:hypothetical protein
MVFLLFLVTASSHHIDAESKGGPDMQAPLAPLLDWRRLPSK